MVWARLDDQFPQHRKVWPRSDAAFRLHVAGICHSSWLLTDGIIDHDRVPGLVPNYKAKALNELLTAGIWHKHDHDCPDCAFPPEGAYVIHDFLLINPSRAKVEAERDAKLERQRQWREKKASEKAAKDAARDASRGVSRDGLRDTAPNPTRPDPARRALGRVSEELSALDANDTEEPDTSLPAEQVELNVTAINSIRDALKGERGAA